MNSNSERSQCCVSGLVARRSGRGVQKNFFVLLLVGRVLREPCSVYKVYLMPLCISEFSLRICTEPIVKELVLGAVYRLTTQAQDFSRGSEQFYISICLFVLQV